MTGGLLPTSFLLPEILLSNAPNERFDAIYDDMTTTIVSVPGSPPDLSGSRSSKSSSSCSTSQFSGAEGVISDVGHFEEIGLDDEKQSSYSAANNSERISTQTPSAANPRSTLTRTPTSPLKSTQNLPTITTTPHTPSKRQSKDNITVQSRELHIRPSLQHGHGRRGFTSSSVTTLPMALENTQPRTRSSSPIHRSITALNTAVNTGSRLRPSPHTSRSSLPLQPRMGSWNPRRKSVQELEAEYHDSDDDLPDETSLWNIPVSPRPPEERISPISSSRGSPERYGDSRSPRPIPLAHARTMPESPPMKGPQSRILPRHRILPPRTSSLQTSPIVESSPVSPKSLPPWRAHRAKSWSLAVTEMSEEARVLSEALELHAEDQEREQERKVQARTGHRSAQPSLDHRSYSAIQLPPLQRGGELDFLPMSKEKEAILSRTRPSWLPPKDRQEEKRHLKEYQKMMAAAIETERRREEKMYQQRTAKDTTREALTQVWSQYVADSRDALDTDDAIKDLWWQGVTSKLRGKIWQRAIGNQLALTPASYEKALRRARVIQLKASEDLTQAEKVMLEWFRDIERDAETAFPDLNMFQRGGPLWQDLVDVCKAYSCYRSDIGYVYGVQLISALFLLQLHEPSDVFILLANCFNRPAAHAFLANDLSATSKTYALATSTLSVKFPRLHGYLFNPMEIGGLSMSAEAVFEPMFRTLLSNGLDVDRLCRMWDCWIFEGERLLVHAVVAVLGALQTQILDVPGGFDTRRRNVQETLGWGPYGRTAYGYWNLSPIMGNSDVEVFMDDVREAGKLDHTGH